MFSCECGDISKNTFFYRTPLVTASVYYSDNIIMTMGISFEVFETLSELLGIIECTRKYF